MKKIANQRKSDQISKDNDRIYNRLASILKKQNNVSKLHEAKALKSHSLAEIDKR